MITRFHWKSNWTIWISQYNTYVRTDNFILISGYNAGERLSAVTGSVQRSTVTSSNRAHSASRRISHQQRQQQQQPQLQQQPRIPLGSLRNSDEHGARANSAQDSCDNSNDSGLGFEDRHQHLANANVSEVWWLDSNRSKDRLEIIGLGNLSCFSSTIGSTHFYISCINFLHGRIVKYFFFFVWNNTNFKFKYRIDVKLLEEI